MSDTSLPDPSGGNPVIVGVPNEGQQPLSPPAPNPPTSQSDTGQTPQPPQEVPPPPPPLPPQSPPSEPPPQPPKQEAPPPIEEPVVVQPKKTKSLKTPGLILGLMLMIVTIPGAVILLQQRTNIVPQAREETRQPEVTKPEEKKSIEGIYWVIATQDGKYSSEEKQLFPKPDTLTVQSLSASEVKISFETETPVNSKLGYSPNPDWNYLAMGEEGVKYNPENEKWISLPENTSHNFILKNLTPKKKYFYIIKVYKGNKGYEFGYSAPDHAYSFTVGEE